MAPRGKAFLSLSVAFFVCVVTARMSLGSGFIGGSPGGLGSVTLTGTPSTGQVPTATGATTATWQTPSGGGTLAQTLANGNVTGGTSVIVSNGDSISAATAAGFSLASLDGNTTITIRQGGPAPSIEIASNTGENTIVDSGLDLGLVATDAANGIYGGTISGNAFQVKGGNLIGGKGAVGGGALATNATLGFVGIPTCPGTPTGTPASTPAGVAWLAVDSTNKQLGGYFGGAWNRWSSGNGTGLVVPSGSGWAWVNQGSSTETSVTRNGRTYLKLVSPAETNHHMRYFAAPIPAPPYAIEAGFYIPATSTQFGSGASDYWVGAALVDSGTGKAIAVGPFPGGSNVISSEMANFTTGTGSTVAASYTSNPHDFIYTRCDDDGTTLSTSFSWNGLDFFPLITFARSGHFTPTHLAVFVDCNDAVHPVTVNVTHLNAGTGI